MKDKNVVILEGLVGDSVSDKKSNSGTEFITFMLCVNGSIGTDTWMSRSDDREHSQTLIRCFVYDRRLIEYCRDTKLRRNKRVSVFGKLQSYRSEIKGQPIVSLVVVVRDIGIIKTKKAAKEEEAAENENKID